MFSTTKNIFRKCVPVSFVHTKKLEVAFKPVLLLHGFGATPNTMLPLKKVAIMKQIQYSAPQLFKNGGQSAVNLEQDLEVISSIIDKTNSKEIWAHSAGALLALQVAQTKKMDTLILINPFINPYQGHFDFTCKIFKMLPKAILKTIFVSNGPIPDEQKGWWLDRSFWSVIKLNDLRKSTMVDLKIIGNPKIIIIQANNDKTSHPDSGKILKSKINQMYPHLSVKLHVTSDGHQIAKQCIDLLETL